MTNQKWENVLSRQIDLQKSLQIGLGMSKYFFKHFGFKGIEKQFYYNNGKTTRFYFFKEEFELLEENFIKSLLDIDFVLNYKNKVWAVFDTISLESINLASNLDKLSVGDLTERFKKFDDAWGNFYVIAWSPIFINVIDNIVKNSLIDQLNISEAEVAKLLNVIAQPNLISPPLAKEIAILDAAQSGNEKAAENIAREWGWMNVYNFGDQPTSTAEVLEEIRVNVKRAKEKLEHILIARKENEAAYQVLFSSIKNDLLKAQIELMHEIGYIRDSREKVRNNMTALATDIYKEIAKRINLALEDVVYLSNSEIIGLLASNFDVEEARHLAALRRDAFLAILELDSIKIVSDQKEIKDFLIEEDILSKETQKTVSGQVASSGDLVKGPVRIIFETKDIEKVQVGDILVATMTKPTFIPAMKKAIAFITDEGGVTCHAAILAREMKKPCIIGTKIATKVFKDGDIVELDSVNGIISLV